MAMTLVKYSRVMPVSDCRGHSLIFRAPARDVAHGCKCLICKPSLYEQAQHPQDLERLRDPHQPLKIWCHEIFGLATMAIESFSYDYHEHLSFDQMHAQNLWKSFWRRSIEYHLMRTTSDLTTLDPQKLFARPISIFNSLFFCSALPARLLRVGWDTNTAKRGIAQAWENGVMILLNPRHRFHVNSPSGLLRTLLHELIHAFLELYACYPAASGCNNDACKTLNLQNRGATGHGRAWQYLAKAIEDASPRLLPGIEIWLGREEVCRKENRAAIVLASKDILASGWTPSSCDRWLFDRYLSWDRCGLWKHSRDDDLIQFAMLKRYVTSMHVAKDSQRSGEGRCTDLERVADNASYCDEVARCGVLFTSTTRPVRTLACRKTDLLF